MNNGRENRTNGNQEKGKEEKEALRSQYEVKKGGRRKRPLCFFARNLTSLSSVNPFSVNPAAFLYLRWDSGRDSEPASPGRDIVRGTRRSCNRSQALA